MYGHLGVLLVFSASLACPLVAHGQSWSTDFGAPPNGQGLNDEGWALLVYQDRLVVGGEFTQAGSIVANRVAAWDGNQWAALGSGIASGAVYDLTEYSGDLVAAGTFGLMRWNGLAWTALVPPGGNQILYTTHSHDGLLYANPRVAGARVLASWNGTAWSTTPMPTPDSEIVDMGTYQGQLILAGGLPQAETTASERVGSSATREIDGFLFAWDGANFGGPGYSLAKVPYCLLVHEGLVYVGAPLATSPQAEMATWDGGNVAAYGPLYITGPLSLESFNGRVVVGMLGVTSFDGMTQVPMPGSPDDGAAAVRVFQGSLYVTGWFTSAGQNESYRIARWWEPVTDVEDTPKASSGLRIDSAPNPFNPSVTLWVQVPATANLSVAIYDAAGRVVRQLISGTREAGTQRIEWDGTGDSGARLASGVYFAKAVSGPHAATRKLILVK